jgi:HEAT repeat protein
MTSENYDEQDEFRQQLQQQPTDELFHLALTAYDDAFSPGWDAITELRQRATHYIFETAALLCQSNDPITRRVGVAILAQLGSPGRIYLEETLQIFFNLLEWEQDPGVLYSVGVGLGHNSPEPRKVKPLLKFKNHPNPEVRFGVTSGLTGEDDPLAIAALIDLSWDEDDDIRDWATFGLGSQTEVDTPEIREALYARAIDKNDPTNAPGEGLLGLAVRGDTRAFDLTVQFLESDHIGTLIFEAAEALADPRLYPLLVIFLNDSTCYGHERSSLERAIEACTPNLI